MHKLLFFAATAFFLSHTSEFVIDVHVKVVKSNLHFAETEAQYPLLTKPVGQVVYTVAFVTAEHAYEVLFHMHELVLSIHPNLFTLFQQNSFMAGIMQPPSPTSHRSPSINLHFEEESEEIERFLHESNSLASTQSSLINLQ